MSLPNDIARCAGVGHLEGRVMEWREGCEDCLRRTAPRAGEYVVYMQPPSVIVFECEYRIEPERGQGSSHV